MSSCSRYKARETIIKLDVVPERPYDIEIPASGKTIYGLLREVEGVPNAPLVVLVHGFTGHRNEPLHYNGSRFLEQAGFATYRFNQYGSEADARKLLECTVETHVADLDLVIGHFRRLSDRPISVIGHSLGGLTIMASKERDFDAVVLWDPTLPERGNFAERPDSYAWVEPLGVWLVKDGISVLVSDEMGASWQAVPPGAITGLECPVKLVAAGDHTLVEACQRYYEAANEPRSLSVVEGADHEFLNRETQQQLFHETVDWLERYGRTRR